MQPLLSCPGCHCPATLLPDPSSKAEKKFQRFWKSLDEKIRKYTLLSGSLSLAIGVGLLASSVTLLALSILPPLGLLLASGVVLLAIGVVLTRIACLKTQFKEDLALAIQLKQLHSIKHYKPENSSKPIALLIQGKHDNNGALHRLFPVELEPTYSIVTCSARGADDIISAVKKIPIDKIGLIWIQAHGQPTFFALDKEKDQEGNECISGLSTDLIETEESKPLLELFQSLPANAPLVLASCLTGTFENKKKEPGLARALSKKLQGRPIFAPKRSSVEIKAKPLGNSSFEIVMRDFLLRRIDICYLNGETVQNRKISANS